MDDNNINFNMSDFSPLPDDVFDVEGIVRRPTSYLKDVWRNFKKRKTALFSFIVLGVLVFMIIFGPMMNEYNYYTNDYDHVNEKPSAEHWFGTDVLGRDQWTRVWQGGRVSLFISLIATILPTAIGALVGGISGYYGGKVDMILQRIVEVLMGIPSMIYNILLVMVLGAGNIATLILAFTITGWLGSARSTRGLVLMFKSRDFIRSSEALGASPMRIILTHLLPNIFPYMVVGLTMSIPNVIFAEAFLSFIGLGIAPPNPSWGQLIKTSSEIFKTHPYQFLAPCICISITMLCFNLMGDGLRDALDPRLHNS